MKIRLALVFAVMTALALEPVAFAKGAPQRKGGGGKPKVSKPAAKPNAKPAVKKPSKPSGGSASHRPNVSKPNVSRPNVSKPSGGGARLPQGKPAQLPQAKPAQRPSLPQARPAERPSTGQGLPSFGGGASHPSKPIAKPNVPSTRPATPNRPATLPAGKPGARPGGKPDAGDFLGMKPDRPTTLPGTPGDRPGIANRPDRPTTLPGKPGDRPGIANRPDRPTTLPGRPSDRPGIANRPGGGNGGEPWRPGDRPGFNPDHRPGHPARPPRPNRPDNWQNIANNNNNQWNSWRQKNEVNINNFQVNRTTNWNSINTRYNQAGWAGRYGSGEYGEWREDVWDFRKDRCEEIWDRREDFWDDCFDDHWWGSCWWRPRPIAAVSTAVSPWWWWRPFGWASAGAFFGATVAAQPVVYDPGTTVIYEGDTYYVNGQASGTATQARQAAIQLATPAVQEIPVPDPPAQGQPETWMPLGVWALTQQEQGDATMFMQFSVNQDGLLAGAYKNVLTGDEQPIVGQLDKKTQRVAWHVGDATQTVYETGLSGLDNDVYSVFVHFGEAQTQTWLLVRLPSPEIPPGTVKLPDLKKQ